VTRNTAETKEQELTLEDVGLMETQLVDLEIQVDELGEREQQLSTQIAEIHTGGGSKEDLPALMRSRSEARDERADVLEAAAALRTRIEEDLEVASVASATQRLKDIRKAHGGLCRVLEDDERAVEKAAIEFKAMVERVNERFATLSMLRGEAEALCDRFPAVPAGPGFPAITVPARREVCTQAALVVGSVMFRDHGHIVKAMQKDADGLRSRRSYREVSGTPGGAIIEAAGPRPWPALTEREQAILDGRKRDAAAEVLESKRFAVEGDRSTERPDLHGSAVG